MRNKRIIADKQIKKIIMEVIFFIIIIAMIVGGSLGVVKAKEPKTKIACLAFLVMGIWICYLAINSPSSSQENDIGDRGYNVSFKGRHCSGTVGCSCPGFEPITNGNVWEESYCKHCKHKKSSHK
jgi:hypothetical protein